MKNLFIFAHQDDEFGVFHEIKRLCKKGEVVDVIYLTSGTLDGGLSHVRNNESISALTQLGVDGKNIFFLGGDNLIPDGRLSQHIEKAFALILDLISNIGAPTRIYTLAWEGGHQDHDAAHLIGVALAKKFNIVDECYQIPLYTGLNTCWIIFRVFVACQYNGKAILEPISLRDRCIFLSYIFYYKSQIKTWIFLMPFLILHYVFWGNQLLQKISLSRLFQRPHEGAMLYERRKVYTYARFFADVDSFKKLYF